MPTLTIVGGGVAGLTLAATLDPAVFEVNLIERRSADESLPTAFGIWPFAIEALERIKLAHQLRARGLLLTTGIVDADLAGRRHTMTKADADTWLITRPELLDLLSEAVPDTVVREHRKVDDPEALDGDLVVAADGARSIVRSTIWGDRPRDTGVVAVRGVTEVPPAAPQDAMHEFWGNGRLFGVAHNPLHGGLGTNWYAAAKRPESSPEEALAWARAAYAGFPSLVRDTLARATPEQTVVNTILESRPARRVVKDRYVLVGDAAHAMSPNLGRGACEAMVDAIVLGEELNDRGQDGVAEYARRRRRAGQRTRAAAAVARRISLSPRIGGLLAAIAGRRSVLS